MGDTDSGGLTAATEDLLGTVGSEQLSQHLRQTLLGAFGALDLLGCIHLPQDQFEGPGGGTAPPEKHYDHLAGPALAAVRSINRLLQHIVTTYPVPAEFDEDASSDGADDLDFDFEFDLVDEGQTSASAGPEATPLSLAEKVAEAAHAYAGMLRTRVVRFGERLEGALNRDDSWPLLAELDDQRHRLSKAVQAVIFGVLRPCVPLGNPIRREEILPAYQSLVGESIMLRTAVVDLAYQISRFNQAVAKADVDGAVALIVGIADHLAGFCARPPYRGLRAEDKRVVLDFRRDLYTLRHHPEAGTAAYPMLRLRQTVEGFTRFLESLSAINHREVLVLHDQRVLEAALQELNEVMELATSDPEAAAAQLLEVVEEVRPCYGRHPSLDDALRDVNPETALAELSASPSSVVTMLQRWMPLVQGALSISG